MTILEQHGIADAEKAMMIGSNRQSVIVTDGDRRVLLTMSDPPTAGLTPNRARMIAKHLVDAAIRLENREINEVKMAAAREAKAAKSTA